MARKKMTPEERAAKKMANGFGVDTAEKLQTLLNRRLHDGGSTTADVMMMWFRLLIKSPEIWEPRYNAWLAAQVRVRTAKDDKEPELDVDPFDRGGTNGRHK